MSSKQHAAIAWAVTLLMLASCINLAFQLVAAKFIARNQQAGGRAAASVQEAA